MRPVGAGVVIWDVQVRRPAGSALTAAVPVGFGERHSWSQRRRCSAGQMSELMSSIWDRAVRTCRPRCWGINALMIGGNRGVVSVCIPAAIGRISQEQILLKPDYMDIEQCHSPRGGSLLCSMSLLACCDPQLSTAPSVSRWVRPCSCGRPGRGLKAAPAGQGRPVECRGRRGVCGRLDIFPAADTMPQTSEERVVEPEPAPALPADARPAHKVDSLASLSSLGSVSSVSSAG